MKTRIALALSISIFLVGAALLIRFAPIKNTTSGRDLVAIAQPEEDPTAYKEFLNDFLSPKNGSTTPAIPLSNTELVGRQLILDYIGLASSGQTDNASIAALADKYVNELETLIQFKTINQSDLDIVADTKANFRDYDSKLAEIIITHGQALGFGSGGNNIGIQDSDQPLYFSATKKIYEETTDKLKRLPTPKSLVNQHLELVNAYYKNAQAMAIVSDPNSDSVSAFVSILSMDSNFEKEANALNEIAKILKSKI